jgi:tight adherence protein C
MNEIIVYICVFVAVFALAMFMFSLFSHDKYARRLKSLQTTQQSAQLKSDADEEFAFKVVKLVEPFAKLTLPKDGWETSPLKVQFLQAGWRGEYAPSLFFGIKTLLTFAIPLLFYLLLKEQFSRDNSLSLAVILFSGAAMGLVLPKIYLDFVISQRKEEILGAFPDALDLLVICMDAGLSFDQALTRVSHEIKIKSKILHDEMELILLEVRSGKSRERALRHFVLRVGIEDINSFASMIIQAERYGTSVSESLKVSSEELRLKRKQRAEERAAKIPVKLLFPVAFFMLPTLLFILAGPAIMEIFSAIHLGP